MRKIRVLIVALFVASVGLLSAIPAGAMTCATNLPDDGLICRVVLTVVGPVCSKYHCG